MRALSILTALGLVIVAANMAQPETRQMAAMGIGTATCAAFANLYKDDPQFWERQFFAWTQGYLSGWNHNLMITGQPMFDMGSLSTERQQARLRSYCDQHPLGNFIEAVWTLSEELKMLPPVRSPQGNRP
jgi:hypothetical protein